MNHLAIWIIIALVLLNIFGPDGVLLISIAGPILLSIYLVYRTIKALFDKVSK